MKKHLALAGAISLSASLVFAGPETIIKQRAKELRDQNNVRQGVAPPSQSTAQPTAPAPGTVVTLTPQQAALARLQASLAAIRPDSPATDQKKQQLTKDLLGAAQGKAPQVETGKLAEDLSAALSEKLLASVTRNRLVQNLGAVLNPSNIPTAQMQDIVADIQAIFQTSGIARKDAVGIANDAKAIAAGIQKTASK